MVGDDDVRAVHAAMWEHARAGRHADAAVLVDRLSSYLKEGSQATGSGEGMMSVADVKRVEAKRAAAALSACSTTRAVT